MSDDLDDSEQLEGDRQTVASLISAGDPLTKARQVDHWIYFPTAAARDRFLGEGPPRQPPATGPGGGPPALPPPGEPMTSTSRPFTRWS
ncbi:MAG: ribonuclease E inhibitor RraB [Myxococcales bacterium]|nr:ribonuclease E inhibitor RraB [Myxococcales bacterium]